MPSIPPVIVHWLTPEKLLYQDWEFWLVLFTFALAVMTGWLALETRALRLESARAIGAAEESAKAALAAVEISHQQLQANIQPMLQVKLKPSGEGESVVFDVHRFSVTVELSIMNACNVPVKLKHTFVVFQVFDGERITEQDEVELEEFQSRVLIADEEIGCREIVCEFAARVRDAR